jgi:hypothetical protein
VPRNLEAEDLVGGKFAAQVGLNKKKMHSKVVHDTSSPAPRQKAAREAANAEMERFVGKRPA